MIFKPQALWTSSQPFLAKLELLFNLGYFVSEEYPEINDNTRLKILNASLTEKTSVVIEAVKKFQNFYLEEYKRQFDGLPAVDGIFGNKTAQTAENMLANRYCNHPDISPMVQGKGLRRWGFKDVTYGHELQKLPEVNGALIHKAYVRAAESWNKICGLEAKYIERTSEANIQAYAQRIDGRGGTLAWSYLPGNGAGRSTQLEQRYDTSDRYTNYSFAEEVIKHEYGHALGFDHDNGQDKNGAKSIMHASAIGIQRQNLNDIKGAVSRYDKPSVEVPTTPDGPTPDVPSPESPVYGGEFTLVEADGRERVFLELTKGDWVV